MKVREETGGQYFVQQDPSEHNVRHSSHPDQDCFAPNVEVMPLPIAAESLTVESFELFAKGARLDSPTTTNSAATPRVARM